MKDVRVPVRNPDASVSNFRLEDGGEFENFVSEQSTKSLLGVLPVSSQTNKLISKYHARAVIEHT